MQAYLSSHWRTQQNLGTGLQQLQGTVSGLAQSRDRDTLLQEHFNTFCMPLCFPYQPHDGDQVCIFFFSESNLGISRLIATLMTLIALFVSILLGVWGQFWVRVKMRTGDQI